MHRPLILCLWLAVGCNDYGFQRSDDAGFPRDKEPDTGDTDTSGGGSGSPDDTDPGGDADTDTDTDTDTDADADTDVQDECWDPDSAYDMHPAAGLVVTQRLALQVSYEGSDAGYTSELYLSSPDSIYLGTGHVTAEGTTTYLGIFDVGTELVFSIQVTDNGNVFYSGPASRNADGFNHAAITYAGDCVWLVGFEDEYGGGDQDFNDIELTISGPLEMQQVE